MTRSSDRRGRLDVPTMLGAAAAGATASGGVVVERLSAGSLSFAACATLVTAAATALAAVTVRRAIEAGRSGEREPGPPALVLVQMFGLAMGVAFVHAVLALIAPPPVAGALAEAPAQLVNDGVLVGGLLLLVWSNVAASRRVRTGLALAAFGLIGAYRATATTWHVDAISFASLTVQHFVCVELAAAAAALLFVFLASPDPRRVG